MPKVIDTSAGYRATCDLCGWRGPARRDATTARERDARRHICGELPEPGGRVRYRRERRYMALGPDSPVLVSPPEVTEGEGTLHTAFCPLLLRPREWYFVHSLAHGAIVIDPHLCDTIEPAEGNTMHDQLRFDGDTFEPTRDAVRLTRQFWDVWLVMRDGQWRTLARISALTNHPEASVSARLRDYRKKRFGSHTVERRYVSDGLWEYRIEPNPHVYVIDGTEPEPA